MDGLILAIDLGKFNSVCCWYDAAIKSATFRQAKTTRADLFLSPSPGSAGEGPGGEGAKRRNTERRGFIPAESKCPEGFAIKLSVCGSIRLQPRSGERRQPRTARLCEHALRLRIIPPQASPQGSRRPFSRVQAPLQLRPRRSVWRFRTPNSLASTSGERRTIPPRKDVFMDPYEEERHARFVEPLTGLLAILKAAQTDLESARASRNPKEHAFLFDRAMNVLLGMLNMSGNQLAIVRENKGRFAFLWPQNQNSPSLSFRWVV
jgi:hypothetical protein